MLDTSLPVICVEPVTAPTMAILTLPEAINDAHQRVRENGRSMLQFAKQAGELLLQAKAQVKHGEFKAWIAEYCHCSYRQAAKYMQVAKCADLGTFDPAVGVDAFLDANATPRNEAPAPEACFLASGPAETPAKTPRAPAAPTGADDSAGVVSLRAELHKVREEAEEAEKFFDEREARLMAEIAELKEALKDARREIKRLQVIIEASPVARVAAMKGTTPLDAGMSNDWDF